jgi:AAHS family 4-hydroxybenzoate transporter-like MFS transporter
LKQPGPILVDGGWDSFLEASPWTRAQKLILVLICAAVIADGLDNLVLAIAIPSMSAAWGVSRGAFAPVFALGLGALSVGTIIAGPLGDRFGRKLMLILCVFLFGACTIATTMAASLEHLMALRVVASLGLGGALPNATALAAEFTPPRARSIGVTATGVAVPFGGIIASLLGATVLPTTGWEGLFYVAGGLPLILTPLLMWFIPSSPQQLSANPNRGGDEVKSIERLGLKPDGFSRTINNRPAFAAGSPREVFSRFYLWDTLALCGAFFGSMTAGYILISWLPSVLASLGFTPAATSQGMLAYTAGGVVGAILAAMLFNRFSSRVLIVFAFAAALGNVLVALLVRSSTYDTAALFAVLAVLGALAMAITSPLFAIAAHVYPAAIRASGIAIVLSLGRLGAVGGGLFGGFAADEGGSAPIFFLAVAAICVVTAVSLIALRRHIPRRPESELLRTSRKK